MRPLILSLFVLTAASAAPIRVLIITGESDLPYHDWRVSTAFVRSVLEQTHRFDVKVTEQPRILNKAALANYDVLVVNYNGTRWTQAAEQAVEDFVHSGKGMIAFHGVSYGPFYGQHMQKRQITTAP
jgi:uncharacterized protein